MSKYVLAHDVGTSSVKTALIDKQGVIIAHCTTAYGITHPQPGWAEQNPDDYWKGSVSNTREVVRSAGIDRNEIIGIVFTTQSMGIIPVDKNGKILRYNITWVDGRADKEARWLMNLIGGKAIFKKIIGTEITGKDVLPKLRWLKNNKPEIYNQTDKVLDVNGFLKYRATGKMVFEWSGACSYIFDLKKKDWVYPLFKLIGFDIHKLPPLVRSTDVVGTLTKEAAIELDLPESIRVFGGCDDTQSAAIGSGSSNDGEAHIYLGTSAWVGITTRKNLKHKNGAVVLQSADPSMNLLVGITESAGSNLGWMIEKFYKYEKNNPEVENIYDFINKETRGIPAGSDHLIFTPWLHGERCPVSTTTTRGTVFNLGPEHSRGHLVNALLEGIGYNLRWIMENIKHDFGFNPVKIRAIGGGSVNDKWMQGIANITGKTVETITQPTLAGTLGAASCVFVGCGYFKSFNDINKIIQVKNIYAPDPSLSKIFDELFKSYKNIYSGLKNAYHIANSERLRK
jgi:xylulokinase